MDRQLQWITQAQLERPEVAAQLQQLGELYSKKLWHQLTVKLEQYVDEEVFQRDGFLIALYQNFISGFAHKINLLKLAFFAVTVAKCLSTPQEGITFLNDVMRGLKAAQTSDADQPILFLQMQAAQYEHVLGNCADAKKMLEEGRRTLDEKSDADPAVSASVHYLAMQLAKEAQSYADFYRASLMYLAFVPQETLDPDQRLALAVDISLAALLGEDIYNFGELLLHPILSTLKDSDYDWLLDILYCFESGNLHEYDTLCSKYASSLNAQPALVANERRLREKITIAALLELIGNLPAESRTLKLSEVAAKTKLPADGVELLLMRALALHLIEGVIDGVNGEVSVGWIAPRVLTHRQVESMASRLEGWLARVETAALMFKEESVGLVM